MAPDIEKLSISQLLGLLKPKQLYSVVVSLVGVILSSFSLGLFIASINHSIEKAELNGKIQLLTIDNKAYEHLKSKESHEINGTDGPIAEQHRVKIREFINDGHRLIKLETDRIGFNIWTQRVQFYLGENFDSKYAERVGGSSFSCIEERDFYHATHIFNDDEIVSGISRGIGILEGILR